MSADAAYRHARRHGALLPQPPAVSSIAAAAEIAGVPVRVFTPPTARATYLHLHGGGFVYGGAGLQDERLEALARACDARVVSVEYRLAPEHPYPAAPDDCEAVALALAAESAPLAIGGESAGANLAVVTLLRLRDRHGTTSLRGAALVGGLYDLTLAQAGEMRAELEPLVGHYAQARALDDPDLSPLRADLRGLPAAVFAVGSADPLREDTLQLEARWRGAGNETRLLVLEGEVHGVDAGEALHNFLRTVL
jgi:acetyl esterase